MKKGLVIRYFNGGYVLCDGKPPKGCENDGEIYIGNYIQWFARWQEAYGMLKAIDEAYGFNSEEKEKEFIYAPTKNDI